MQWDGVMKRTRWQILDRAAVDVGRSILVSVTEVCTPRRSFFLQHKSAVQGTWVWAGARTLCCRADLLACIQATSGRDRSSLGKPITAAESLGWYMGGAESIDSGRRDAL